MQVMYLPWVHIYQRCVHIVPFNAAIRHYVSFLSLPLFLALAFFLHLFFYSPCEFNTLVSSYESAWIFTYKTVSLYRLVTWESALSDKNCEIRTSFYSQVLQLSNSCLLIQFFRSMWKKCFTRWIRSINIQHRKRILGREIKTGKQIFIDKKWQPKKWRNESFRFFFLRSMTYEGITKLTG